MKCQIETSTQRDTAARVDFEFNEDYEDRWDRNWLKLLPFTYLQHRENEERIDCRCSMQHVMQPSDEVQVGKKARPNDRGVPGAWLKDRFAYGPLRGTFFTCRR